MTKPKKNDKIAVRVLRDFWPEKGMRVRKGTITEIDPMAAIEGIEKGLLETVK